MNPHKPKSYYSLSFDFKFEFGNDDVFIAYTVPYTYTKIISHIKQLKLLSDSTRADFVKFKSIGKSNGGLDMPLIQISNPSKIGPDPGKPTILIIGRQHSGETHSSFIIHGLLNFLMSRDPLAFKLRDAIEFMVIPAMNPDGIVCGNYRCNT